MGLFIFWKAHLCPCLFRCGEHMQHAFCTCVLRQHASAFISQALPAYPPSLPSFQSTKKHHSLLVRLEASVDPRSLCQGASNNCHPSWASSSYPFSFDKNCTAPQLHVCRDPCEVAQTMQLVAWHTRHSCTLCCHHSYRDLSTDKHRCYYITLELHEETALRQDA